MGLSQTAWVLIAFILFFVLVGKKLWSALTTNLDQRKKMIENEGQLAASGVLIMRGHKDGGKGQ